MDIGKYHFSMNAVIKAIAAKICQSQSMGYGGNKAGYTAQASRTVGQGQ